MLKFAYSPWEEESSKLSKWKNSILGIILLSLLAVSLTSIFINTQSYAQTISDRCSSITIYGDRVTKDMGEKGDVVDKLKNDGVREVKINAQNGRRMSDVRNEINKDKNEGNSSDCIILDVGIENVRDGNSDARKKEIEDLINDASKSSKNVFWVLPSAKQGTPGVNTAPLQTQIREGAKLDSNVYPISIDQLTFKNDLFNPDGISMTNDGYQQRADAIIGGIDEALNPATQDPTTSSAVNPSNTQNPNTGGNNNPGGSNTGNGNSGGGNTGILGGKDNPPVVTDNGSLQTTGESGNHQPTDSIDLNDEKQKGSSPAYYANIAKNVTNTTVAERYLVLGRWDSLTIPARGFSFSGEAVKQTLNSNITELFMTLSLLVSKLSATVIDFTFGFSITDIILKQIDKIFGGIVAGTSNSKAPILVYFSSIVTFTIIMSALSAFNTRSGASMQSRITGIFTAVIKAIFAALIVYYMGVQSSKNSDPSASNEYNQIVEVFQKGKIDALDSTNGEETEIGATKSSDFGELSDSKQTIARPGTWHAFSLGWIVSMVFYVAQLLVAAILSFYTAIIKLPLDGLQDNLNPLSTGTAMPACDRYVDSMHQTFMATQVYEGNTAYGNVRLALDKIVFNYLYQPYSSMYGATTIASRNSWCWVLENNSGRPAGDWLMLARGAGLYRDAAGSGSLIIPNKYNNGRHNIEHVNTQEDIPVYDGSIVRADGTWVDGTEGLKQAQIYMGILGGQKGREQARYYFAACRFDPGQSGVLLNEWAGVMPMYSGYGDAENIEKKEKTNRPEYGSENLLNDQDCIGSQIIPSNAEEVGEYGFGSRGKGQTAAERWEYTLPDADIFSGLAESVVDAMPLIGGRKGKEQEDDENQSSPTVDEDPNTSDTVAEGGGSDSEVPKSEDGPEHINEKWAYNPRGTAKIFWDAVNGLKGSAMSLIAIFILALSGILLVDFLVVLFPIMIIKVVAGLIFLLVPLSIMFSAIGYAFKGGRK